MKFVESYKVGNFVDAEKNLLLFLNSEDILTTAQLSAAYNNLGAIYTLLGRYTDALDYYNRAESIAYLSKINNAQLADIFINKAIIYGNQNSYQSAVDYFEKGIRIYNNIKDPDKSIYHSISAAYLNIGIIYIKIEEFKTALSFLEKSAELKRNFNLTEISLVYLNIARTDVKLKKYTEAERFFLKSIESSNKEFGANHFRLAEVYFGYGQFLQTIGKTNESIEILKRALSICQANYGEKHTFTSLAFKNLGDSYTLQNKYDSALYYYQHSLISIVKDFNNTDIFSNPPVDSSLFDIRLLDNLKSKSQALEMMANQQNDPAMKLKTMETSLETIELALNLIDIIRSNYLSEDSRIYLAENEKETYIFATHVAGRVYDLSRNDSLVYKIYGIAQKAKAAILRNEITGNDLLYSAAIPDSLREKQTSLSANISAYNKLVQEESRNSLPDSSKIALWKDALFDMNREKEKVTEQIGIAFPEYSGLLRKTDPLLPGEIQKKLKQDETIVDYLLSNRYVDGKRKLYTFLISHDDLIYRESEVDSMFIKNATILRNTAPASAGNIVSFNNYTSCLNYMYINLIKPVEELITGDKLIIIPDEEIGWLPFDAFIREMPGNGVYGFEGLSYLINDYTFSYGYSSSLLFDQGKRPMRGAKVISFSPSYGSTIGQGNSPASLDGALSEIESIYKWFRGTMYTGDKATRTNFSEAMREPAIFHLAMHSMSDTINSRYSYILFDKGSEEQDSGCLYNYEISLGRINSPMVVLSACSSGTGTLYSGEGLMSLARGFMLAGASSLIKTAWEVNDESSSEIITNFYKYLSQGKQKNVALRLAKLEYISNASPAQKNPYYWAAYEVLGDNSPVAGNRLFIVILLTMVVFLTAGGVIIYLRRRRIFSARAR